MNTKKLIRKRKSKEKKRKIQRCMLSWKPSYGSGYVKGLEKWVCGAFIPV
jgi:hypothetical protein